MSVTAALPTHPQLPPPLPSHSLFGGNNSSSLSKRSSESPRSNNSKTPAPAPVSVSVYQPLAQRSPPAAVTKSPAPHMPPRTTEDRTLASPAPVKLPEATQPAAVSPRQPSGSPPLAQPAPITTHPTGSPNNKITDSAAKLTSEQAPAQLALLLSQALTEADTLRRDLVSEKKRVARLERLLDTLQHPSSPNSAPTGAEPSNTDDRLHGSAAKAVLDAEARTEKAERARDDALHALASLSACFGELERYEAACALRTSDARGVYSRLLTSLATAQPVSQSSPALSTNSPREELRLNLPQVPAPLPSLPPANHLAGINLPLSHSSTQSSRYARALPLPPLATYVPVHSPTDSRHANAFDSLPLPPPPSATGLSSMNLGVPMKRTHSHRSRMDELEYEDQKRRRLTHEMDVDVVAADVHSAYAPHTHSRHSSHYQSGPPSAYPTGPPSFGAVNSPSSRIYDRPSSVQYGYPPPSGQSYQREGAPSYAPAPASGSRYSLYDDWEREYASRDVNMGMVRVDARELVRDAKARERRGRERDSYARHSQPDAYIQPQPQGAVRNEIKGRRRSVSRSSTRSKSSLSLEEMLLETATDGGRGRLEPSERSTLALGGRQSHNYGASSQSINGVSAAPAPHPATQPLAKAPAHAPTVNGNGRKSSVPASQLLTLGPSGTVVSGGGTDGAAAASVDPAVRYPGLRTCRQCGLPGRYKEGKCVEKWGPGPQGPGTVCDRCRKKMKRVERRGTLDASSASLRGNHSQAQKGSNVPLHVAHSQTYTQSQSQSSRARALPSRTDTLIVEPEQQQRQQASDRSRSPKPGHGSRYAMSDSVPAASAAARHPSLAGQAQALYSPHSQPHHPHSRRAPTPPYITTISSREQHNGNGGGPANSNSTRRHAESEDDLLEEGDEPGTARSSAAVAASAARYAHSESYARQQPIADERDELADDRDGDADADVDADGSGVGSADADAEVDADADIMDAVDATMKVED